LNHSKATKIPSSYETSNNKIFSLAKRSLYLFIGTPKSLRFMCHKQKRNRDLDNGSCFTGGNLG